MKKQIESVDALHKELEKLIRILLKSNVKRDIIRAFHRINCIVVGECICDLCEEWDNTVELVYEFSRCMIPSRVLQLIKERHYPTKRWEYIKPLYEDLFNKLYDDVLPTTGALSNKEMENIKCSFKISQTIIDETLKQSREEADRRVKALLKKKKE